MKQSYHLDFVQNRTLNIIEASKFLGAHKETILRMAAIGQIPGVKIGRSWRFIESDLLMHMRSQYRGPNRVIEKNSFRRNNEWPSKKEMISGELTSHIKEHEYAKALELK